MCSYMYTAASLQAKWYPSWSDYSSSSYTNSSSSLPFSFSVSFISLIILFIVPVLGL